MPRATQNAQHTNVMQENRAVGRGSMFDHVPLIHLIVNDNFGSKLSR